MQHVIPYEIYYNTNDIEGHRLWDYSKVFFV
jgi:hypothetical protein